MIRLALAYLVRHYDAAGGLHDLKRKGHVGRARNAGEVTLDLRVPGDPVVEVLLLLGGGPGLVGDLVPLDDSQARRQGADRAELEHRALAGLMILQIPMRRPDGLPDAIQVRLAVSRTRDPDVRRLSGDRVSSHL